MGTKFRTRVLSMTNCFSSKPHDHRLLDQGVDRPRDDRQLQSIDNKCTASARFSNFLLTSRQRQHAISNRA